MSDMMLANFQAADSEVERLEIEQTEVSYMSEEQKII